MRYVGRHRGPRPLFLRRPVVGGAVVLVLLAGPAYAIANGINNPIRRPATTADASVSTSSPNVSASTVVPTDDSELASVTDPTTTPTGAPLPNGGSTTGSGGGGGSNNGGGGGGGNSTTGGGGPRTTTPKTTTPKVTRTTKPPVVITTKPPVVIPTTLPPPPPTTVPPPPPETPVP